MSDWVTAPTTRTDSAPPSERPAVGEDDRGRTVDALWRAGMATALVVGFVLQTLTWSRVVTEGRQGYQVGDWLISYAVGPVRRGLFGEALRRFVPEASTGLSVLFWTLTTAYAVLLVVALVATVTVRAPRRWAAMLLSPAFLLFGVNDYWGAYRKEVLGLVCLALVVLARRLPRGVTVLTFIAVGLFGLAAFSHEVNALLGPAVVLAIMDLRRAGSLGRGPARAAIGAVSGLAAGGLSLAAAFGGSTAIADGICADLVARGFAAKACVGSMGHLGEGVADGASFVIGVLFPSWMAAYAAALLFALLPFRGLGWSRRRRCEVGLVAAGVAPLILVGVDYGRWIAIAATVATLFALADGAQGGLTPRSMPLTWLLLFLTAWRLPHAPSVEGVFGPSGLVLAVERILDGLPVLGVG